jgi:hypothetical protein
VSGFCVKSELLSDCRLNDVPIVYEQENESTKLQVERRVNDLLVNEIQNRTGRFVDSHGT